MIDDSQNTSQIVKIQKEAIMDSYKRIKDINGDKPFSIEMGYSSTETSKNDDFDYCRRSTHLDTCAHHTWTVALM